MAGSRTRRSVVAPGGRWRWRAVARTPTGHGWVRAGRTPKVPVAPDARRSGVRAGRTPASQGPRSRGAAASARTAARAVRAAGTSGTRPRRAFSWPLGLSSPGVAGSSLVPAPLRLLRRAAVSRARSRLPRYADRELDVVAGRRRADGAGASVERVAQRRRFRSRGRAQRGSARCMVAAGSADSTPGLFARTARVARVG